MRHYPVLYSPGVVIISREYDKKREELNRRPVCRCALLKHSTRLLHPTKVPHHDGVTMLNDGSFSGLVVFVYNVPRVVFRVDLGDLGICMMLFKV